MGNKLVKMVKRAEMEEKDGALPKAALTPSPESKADVPLPKMVVEMCVCWQSYPCKHSVQFEGFSALLCDGSIIWEEMVARGHEGFPRDVVRHFSSYAGMFKFDTGREYCAGEVLRHG